MLNGRLLCAGIVLAMLGCGSVSGQETTPAPTQRLYLLAATPTENINYGTNRYPAILYRANSAKKLEVVREIVSEKDGSAAVQAVGNAIFVVDAANFTVNVIHTDDPARSDSVAINADHLAGGVDLQDGLTAAAPQDMRPEILLQLIIPAGNSPPTSELVIVSNNQTGSGSRVQIGRWNDYRELRREGLPGIPILSLSFGARIDGDNLTYTSINTPRHSVVVDNAPPPSLAGKNGFGLPIEAANERYLVLGFPLENPLSQVLVHDRARDNWTTVKIESKESRLRLFGPWLATDVEMESSGPFADDKPEKSGERDTRTSRLPNVYGEYGAYCWLSHRRFPGILVLQNLADGRNIRIETHQEDSEILWVGTDTLVYRINDSIYQAAIAGDKIKGITMLVKGDDIPEVHWVFWSN
jgi:hypothetical protein